MSRCSGWGALLVGAAALAPLVAAADAARATATASKAEVTVGERFTVDVKAEAPAGATIVFPPELVQDTVELRAIPLPSPAPPGAQRYEAAVFALGDASVPPIPVRYRLPTGAEEEIRTAAIPLKVVSLLPKDKAEQKLADIQGPVGLGIGRAFWMGLAVALVLIGALAWWLWSRRRKREAPAAVVAPPQSPEEEALRALDALAASRRLAQGEYRPFYIELTTIAKRYLERRLGAPILEMTTAEMLSCLRTSPHGGDVVAPMRDLAGAADRIKFARGAGLHDEAERHLGAVRGLVHALEARLRPAAPAAPEGGRAA